MREPSIPVSPSPRVCLDRHLRSTVGAHGWTAPSVVTRVPNENSEFSFYCLSLSLLHSCPLRRVFLHGIRAEEALTIGAFLERQRRWHPSSAPNAAAAQTLRIRPPAFTEGKLDGTNYTLWKFKITAILNSYELLDVVQSRDAKSQPTLDPANPGNMLLLDVDLLQAWKRKNADAMCALVTSTTDSILTLIQHTTKAPEACNILKG